MFLNVGNRLLLTQYFYHQNLLIKILFYHSPLQIWLFLLQLLFKFKSPLLKPKPKIKFNEFII
jgi:hypothetical protein